MLSIFDIPTSKDQLSSSNANLCELQFDEIQALRNISDETNANRHFPGSEITFRWDYPSGKHWLPSKSYLRYKCSLTKADGSPLTENDNIAPAMGLADSLIHTCNLKIADKVVEEVSNMYSEIAALRTRLSKTGQWMRDCGNVVNYWESNPQKRQQNIISDGVIAKECRVSKAPLIQSRQEMGFESMNTIDYAVGDSVLTFAAGALAVAGLLERNLRQNVRSGDVIVIHSAVVGSELQAFFIKESLTPLTFTALPVGELGADINALALDFSMIKYSRATINNHLDNTKNYVTATQSMDDILPTTASQIKQGQLVFSTNAAGTEGAATIYVDPLARDHFIHPSFGNGRAGNIVANAAAQISIVDHDGAHWTSGPDLGYHTTSANIVQHKVEFPLPVGTGKSLMTFETVANPELPLPNVRDVWRAGDFIVWQRIAAAEHHMQVGLVWEVDTAVSNTNSGQRLWVIGGKILNAATDSGEVPNRIVGRLRIPGPSQRVFPNKARKAQEFQLIWRPCLSVFDLSHSIPGGGKFELNITPFNTEEYQRNAIESWGTTKVPGTDYIFKVLDLRMYNAVCQGPLTENKQYLLDLQQTRCTSISLTTSSKVQYAVDVQPSLNAITIAFADEHRLGNTLYSNTRFKIRDSLEQRLKEMYIRISQLQLPQPDWELTIDDSTGKDLMTEIYGRNLLYNGGYYDSSCEDIDEFFERGLYIHTPVCRTATDRSTRLNVSTRFDGNTLFSDNGIVPHLLIFDHYKKVAIVQINDGRITSIRVSNS